MTAVTDDWDDDDSFDTPPPAETHSAPTDMEMGATAVATRTVRPPTLSDTDDGELFGWDPDFASSNLTGAGAAFTLPANDEIVEPIRRSQQRARQSASHAPDDDEPQLSSRQRRREASRERREARREDRSQTAESSRNEADDTPGHTERQRRKWPLAVGAVFAGGVAVFVWVSPFADDNAPPEPQGPVMATTQVTPAFGPDAQCRPGTASDGSVISNSAPADTRGGGAAAIAAMENAYYGQRDGAAVASHMSPALRPQAQSIQTALDKYFPPGTEVSYCLRVRATGDPNVSDVSIIESRNGAEFKRVEQRITTEKSATGGYLVAKVVESA